MNSVSQLTDAYFRGDLIAGFILQLAKAAVVTIELAALVVVCGILLGLALAITRTFVRAGFFNAWIIASVDTLRAFPPLVLVMLLYFGLPNLNLYLSAFQVLWLALALVLAAFSEEIFWAGIVSVRKGQWEAARSTGLTFTRTLMHVVLPQAMRLTIAPLTNRTIAITKNTALGGIIGVPEILSVASTGQSFSGNSTPLMMGALAYIALFLPIVVASRWVEKRFAWKRA